jgi:RNA polymerase sigma factor (sigma-70 family)
MQAIDVSDHIGLVPTVLRRVVVPRDVETEEVFAEGFFALVLAARTYDPDRGFTFSTLACRVIESRMRRACRTRRYRRLRLLGAREDGTDLLAEVADERGLEEPVEQRECRELLARLMASLHAIDREVLRMVFGLDGLGERTRAEAGAALRLSAARVSQIVERALARMRKLAPVSTRELFKKPINSALGTPG